MATREFLLYVYPMASDFRRDWRPKRRKLDESGMTRDMGRRKAENESL